MDDAAKGAASATCSPEQTRESSIAYEQEIRLAVVMYGGVSLAIYINGVAQELLRLVQATAPDPAHPDCPLIAEGCLSPVQAVYRELGRRIGLTATPADGAAPRKIRTRFMVDAISGTSAGGINGVFLACALARNQTMDQLKQLWISEGDLEKLLNDGESYKDLNGRLGKPGKTESLLNSRRMYLKLLEALEGMARSDQKSADGTGSSGWKESPLVDEIDLFVTATDLRGLLVKLRLADAIVYERRYRNVFHFAYCSPAGVRDPHNDLCMKNNPFLAFAARCTSSFPVAFEPMRLDRAITDADLHRENDRDAERLRAWERFYSDYLDVPVPGREKDPRKGPFEVRAFGDGGYLDNKPFSYAAEVLRERPADHPIQRKLLYVEPSPEHPELDPLQTETPDAFENLRMAAMTIPRQETIREDLERLLERNRRIEYVKRAMRYVGRDFHLPQIDRAKPDPSWREFWPCQMVSAEPKDIPGVTRQRSNAIPYGGGYGPYHRLKVSEVTSDMADHLAALAGLDPGSDEGTAVRFLLSAWRQYRYGWSPDPARSHPEVGRPFESENAFLMDFDLDYRLRRLRFVMERIDVFLADPGGSTTESIADRRSHADEVLAITAGSAFDGRAWSARASKQPEVRGQLQKIRRKLAEAQVVLRKALHELQRPSIGPQNPFRSEDCDGPAGDGKLGGELHARVIALGIGWDDLKAILEDHDPAERVRTARRALGIGDDWRPRPGSRALEVDAILAAISERLIVAFTEASRLALEELSPPTKSDDPLMADVRKCLLHHYWYFDYFDMVLFPMVAGTDVGEMREVEIIRVSPEDADSLIPERDPATHQLLRSKLAGTRLGHFGAFLDETWRRSDILWGRLDGAERIFDAIYPTDRGSIVERADHRARRDEMLRRLQGAIVCEELLPLGPIEARRVFVEALLHTRDNTAHGGAMLDLLERLGPHLNERHVAAWLSPTKVLRAYHRRFRFDRNLTPEREMRYAGRASQIFGRLLEDLEARYESVRKRAGWMLIFIGRIAAGVVEVAIPRSLGERVGNYWLYLLYLIAMAMTTVGAVIASRTADSAQPSVEVLRVGVIGLLAILAIDLGIRIVRAIFDGRWHWVARVSRFLLGIGVLVLALLEIRNLAGMRLEPRVVWWGVPLVLLVLMLLAPVVEAVWHVTERPRPFAAAVGQWIQRTALPRKRRDEAVD